MSARDALAQTLISMLGGSQEDGERDADRILAALDAAGWQVVPKVATEEMKDAAFVAQEGWHGEGDEGLNQTEVETIWRAMLAAARKAG